MTKKDTSDFIWRKLALTGWQGLWNIHNCECWTGLRHYCDLLHLASWNVLLRNLHNQDQLSTIFMTPHRAFTTNTFNHLIVHESWTWFQIIRSKKSFIGISMGLTLFCLTTISVREEVWNLSPHGMGYGQIFWLQVVR